MKLHHSPASPFVRKVMVLLHETGMADRVEISPAMGTPVDPGTMPVSRNPLGKIPCFERSDGPALYDSRVICRYLDDLAGAGLYPTGAGLWDVLTLEATADGIMEAAVLIVYEGRTRDPGERSEAWVSGQREKIARALAALEERWMGHLGGPLHMGQIAVGCALGYLGFRLPDWDWAAERPTLQTWYQGFAARPSMQETAPPAA
ncbi:MAG: glutathione S-transferase [Pseudomonadota bacterium]